MTVVALLPSPALLLDQRGGAEAPQTRVKLQDWLEWLKVTCVFYGSHPELLMFNHLVTQDELGWFGPVCSRFPWRTSVCSELLQRKLLLSGCLCG